MSASVLLQDVRYALRSLFRAPGFTLVALLTLAIGIGGTTAIFAVVDGVLLRPLPYPDSAAIVSVFRTSATQADGSFSAADYLDFRRASRSFSALAGYRQDLVNLTTGAQPVRLVALETTAAFFDVFRLSATHGRVYSEQTDSPRGPRVAVASASLWRQHLGGDPRAIGTTLRINGEPMTLLGVLPDGFAHPAQAEIWILAPDEVPTSPLAIKDDPKAAREVYYFQAIGRLRPGVSVEQATADLDAIAARMAGERPNLNAGESAAVRRFHDTLVGDVRAGIIVLFGAVVLVLLIACANVAGLLLARGTQRRRELAVRTALGAGRARLIVQLVVETCVLAAAGGALGLIVASWGIDALVALAPSSIPRLDDIGLDRRVALFAIAASAGVGLLCGVVPAIQATRASVSDALKDGGRTGTTRTRTQRVLVVSEVALALMLLIGAGLLLTSFARLRAVDLGFDTTDLITIGVPVPQTQYDRAAQMRFYTELFERLRANPITATSALVFPAPFSGGAAFAGYHVDGAPPVARAERTQAQLSAVTPGYFQTLGIPLLRGRDVALTDVTGRPSVMVINETMARREWPGEDPLGKRVTLGPDVPKDDRGWITVIGVVGDSRRSELAMPAEPAVYLPHTQFVLPMMGVTVRAASGVEPVTSAVRDALRALDPGLPLGDVDAVDALVAKTTGQPRFRAALTAAFALTALLLAAVGLYGLISYTVAQRVPEIGVRLALGATPGQVRRLVLGQGLRLAALGVALGLAGAMAATRLLDSLLYAVSATEPMVFAVLALALLAIAALASYVPARRAMRVDPVTALRAE